MMILSKKRHIEVLYVQDGFGPSRLEMGISKTWSDVAPGLGKMVQLGGKMGESWVKSWEAGQGERDPPDSP